MNNKIAKYTLGLSGGFLFALAARLWLTRKSGAESAAALIVAGLGLLMIAPTVKRDWSNPAYALGAVLLVLGVSVMVQWAEGGWLPGFVHDLKTDPAQTDPARLLPQARAEVVGWGVTLDGVPEALSPDDAAAILAEVLPRGALVEVDMTSGVEDVWPEFSGALAEYGLSTIKTIRQPEV